MNSTHGWMTGDLSSIAVWEHLPSGLRCQLVLHDDAGQTLTPTDWEAVEEYLPHDDCPSLAHLILLAGDARVEVECGGAGDTAACLVKEISGAQITAEWQVVGSLEDWQIEQGGEMVTLAPAGGELPADVQSFLNTQRDIVRHVTPQGGGQLHAPLAALEATLAANTVQLPDSDLIVTLSRHEVEATGEWRVPNWETFLAAIAIAYVDPNLAIANCRSALQLLTVNGMLSMEATADGAVANLSSPPVAAFAVWKIFQLTGDDSLLNECYRPLLRWHHWWHNHRDGNHDRLLGWAAPEETGMPDHPLYALAIRNPETGLMELDDLALCSLWALDAFALMRMALQLDDLDQATQLETEIHDIVDWVNLNLWEPSRGTYFDHRWDGRPVLRQSATALLSFIGGIPSHSRLRRMLDEHLNIEFDTPYLVASLGDGDPAFNDQLPWRGRVSPLLNYLISEGLRHFGEDVWAEMITLSGLELITRSWDDHHHAYASYNAVTGEGADLPQDPLAPASTLFSALGIGMLIDIEPWNGLRLGNLHGAEMEITGLHFMGHGYDLASSERGFTALRDGQPWLEVDGRAIIRNLQELGNEISLQLKAAETGLLRLRFHGYQPGARIVIKVNGVARPVEADADGVLERIVPLPPAEGMRDVRMRM